MLFDYYCYCNCSLIALANTWKTFLVDLLASASYCLRFLSTLYLYIFLISKIFMSAHWHVTMIS